MASCPRRAKVVLAIVALAVVGLGVWRGEALYWWVMTERVFVEYRPSGVRGWHHVSRWSTAERIYGPHRLWAPDGYVWQEGVILRDKVMYTVWWKGGQVLSQHSGDKDNTEERSQPPWLWGVTDQTEPSIPEWMKEDDKWARALEASKFKW